MSQPSKIKNVSGIDLIVPGLGGRLVVAGAVVEVPADAVYGFTCQAPNWEPVDASAKSAHTKGAKAEHDAQNPTPDPEPEAPAAEKEND